MFLMKKKMHTRVSGTKMTVMRTVMIIQILVSHRMTPPLPLHLPPLDSNSTIIIIIINLT